MTPRYRSDIDGLRAVAVLPVVLYHAGVAGLPGGFIGVDVFFVISGALIGQILFAEIDAGTFSLVGFYERRARRILPAFLVCLAATLLAGWWVLVPESAAELARSAVASAVFLSNLWFYVQAQDYFDAPAATKPLLHTWSLAVEEQFYIVFPWLLIGVAALSRRLGGRLPLREFGIAALLAVSLALAVRGTTHHPQASFYLLPTRLWELLVGSLIVLPAAANLRVPGPLADCLGAIGLAMIAVPMVLYSPATPFPGLAALPPTLGAALVIVAGRDGYPTMTARLLGSAPLRAIGLVSYSLYLWHVPVIVLGRAWLGADPGLAVRIGMVVVSLVLAVLSWRWVERPFRTAPGVRPSARLLKAYGGALGAGLVAVFGVAWANGSAQRAPAAFGVLFGRDRVQEPLYDACFDGLHVVRRQPFCLRGAAGHHASFALIGDSHGEAIAPGVFAAAQQAGVAGLQVTQSGWRPLYPWLRSGWEDDDLGKAPQVRAVLADPAIRTVVIAVYWGSALGQSYHRADSAAVVDGARVVPAALSALIAAHPAKRFVLLTDVPISDAFGLREQAQAQLFGRTFDPAVVRSDFDAENARIAHMLAPLTALSNVQWIDLGPNMCDRRRCQGARDGRSLYVDASHITPAYARSLAPLFVPVLKAAAR